MRNLNKNAAYDINERISTRMSSRCHLFPKPKASAEDNSSTLNEKKKHFGAVGVCEVLLGATLWRRWMGRWSRKLHIHIDLYGEDSLA